MDVLSIDAAQLAGLLLVVTGLAGLAGWLLGITTSPTTRKDSKR